MNGELVTWMLSNKCSPQQGSPPLQLTSALRSLLLLKSIVWSGSEDVSL